MADLLSVDIEISNVFNLRPGEDLDRHAPFDISVAATAIDGGEELIWYSTDEGGCPLSSVMTERAGELLRYLAEKQRDGFMICAWNGLGFDFRWIGYAAGNMRLAAQIALKSFDPMFQFFNQRGFLVSLAKVAKGMGIGQTKLMSSADAPKRWHAGDYESVMDYVLGDCQMTNKIIRAIQREGGVRWITKRGTPSFEPMPSLKSGGEVLRDPLPDQSWMNTPIPRSKFLQWLPSEFSVHQGDPNAQSRQRPQR